MAIIWIIWPLILESVCTAFQRNKWKMGVNYQGSGTLNSKNIIKLFIIFTNCILPLKKWTRSDGFADVFSWWLHVLSSPANILATVRDITMFDIIWTSRIFHKEHYDTKPKTQYHATHYILLIQHHLEATSSQIFTHWKTLLPKSAGGPLYTSIP